MVQWWNGMTVFQQVTAVIAIVASVLLVIQIILLLIGLGHSADVDIPTVPDRTLTTQSTATMPSWAA